MTRIQLGVRQHYSTEITKENEKLKSKLQKLTQSFEQLQNELSWAYQDKSMLRDKCTNLEKEVNSLTLTNINFGKELQLSKEQCLKQQINNSEEKYHDCQEHMDILNSNDVSNCNQDIISTFFIFQQNSTKKKTFINSFGLICVIHKTVKKNSLKCYQRDY